MTLEKMLFYQVYEAPKKWSSAFTRVAYCRSDRPDRVLVEYTGDASVAGQFLHGNATKTTRDHIRTMPHVLHEIQASTGSAQQIYRSMVTTASSNKDATPSAMPRNTEQVSHKLSYPVCLSLLSSVTVVACVFPNSN
jgi:hypothetical protein